MKSNLRGRVKNIVLSKANGLLPLFEATVHDAVVLRGEKDSN